MPLPRRRTLVVIGLTVLLQSTACLPGAGSAAAEPSAETAAPTDPVTAPADPVVTTEAAPATTSASEAPSATPAAESPSPAEVTVAPPASEGPEPRDIAGAAVARAGVSKFFSRRDVVVYGGTPAGVAAAVAAAEEGSRVLLVTESATVGGMMSNGISASDIGSPLAVQGLAKRFYERVRAHYRDPATWRFEPHVAEAVLARMLADARVRVVRHAPLRSVQVADRRIACARFGAAVHACGHTFIDASYTGDLITEAGVPHRLGMGDFYDHPQEQLPQERDWAPALRVAPEEAPAARAAFEDNPFVAVREALEPYAQAYVHGTPSIAYRLCVTKVPENRKPFRPAAGYDSLLPSFRLLARSLRPEVRVMENGTLFSDVFQLAVIPGGKYDLNAGSRALTNLPTVPGYFDRDADRAALNRQVRDYVESFFHFAQTDPAVPASLRQAFAPFGLCADEFTDNGGWPREPYVREGPRIQGRYTVTEDDIFRHREKATAVAVASYNLDSKTSQFVFTDDTLYKDVAVHTPAPVYEIPFEAMVPVEGGLLNLLAPVGVSASPTAYGSIRMEPQYMALAEAAGVAAALAGSTRRMAGEIPVAGIQQVLTSRGVLHTAGDICRATPRIFRAVGGYTFYCDVVAVTPRAL